MIYRIHESALRRVSDDSNFNSTFSVWWTELMVR